MEIVMNELAAMRDAYRGSDLLRLVEGIDFLVYGVARGNRVPAVCELLYERPYDRVSNYLTGDESISVLEAGEKEPALLIVEGRTEAAGIADMIGAFGARIFSIGFSVTDLDGVRDTLIRAGAEILREPGTPRNGARYLATTQSSGTRDSYFYVERSGRERSYDFFENAEPADVEPEILETLRKRRRLKAFGYMTRLDHVAYRVHFRDITRVGEEFMKCTPYLFSEAHEIEEHDARTVVFRFGTRYPALVASYGRSGESLVEQYVNSHGPRVHHMAYGVTDIYRVVSLQKRRGLRFTSEEVIGAPAEGIAQIFTQPSGHTGEITEYIQRFDGFTGFFSRKNVGNLMTSTRAFQ